MRIIMKKGIITIAAFCCSLFTISGESSPLYQQTPSPHSTPPQKTIISLEEYDGLSEPSAPTVFSYTSPENQLLIYLGTSHVTNLKNSQYAAIDKHWRAFLERTKGKPTAIISETLSGDVSHNGYTSKTEAITYGADCGYATWLGETNTIPVIGAELSHKAVIQQLLKEFDKDKVYYFCFAIAADFWTRYKEKPDLEHFILERVHTWTNDKTITFKHLTGLHKLYTGKSLTTPSKHFFIPLMTLTYHTSYLERALTYFYIPTSALNVIYPMLRRSHQIRDEYAFDIISDQWKSGKNIFIVYGALHAITLKKHLKKLTQQQSAVFHQKHTAK